MQAEKILENTKKAKKIIEDNYYLSLATTSKDGHPWVAPVFFAYDGKYNFYFVSAKDSLHVAHLNANPHVAGAIYNSQVAAGEGDGVQFSGVAREVPVEDLPRVLDVYYTRRYPIEMDAMQHSVAVKDFQGDAIFRVYSVRPIEVYTLDLTFKDVDVRIKVSIPE